MTDEQKQETSKIIIEFQSPTSLLFDVRWENMQITPYHFLVLAPVFEFYGKNMMAQNLAAQAQQLKDRQEASKIVVPKPKLSNK